MKSKIYTVIAASSFAFLSMFLITSCGDPEDDKETRGPRLKQVISEMEAYDPEMTETDSIHFLYNAGNQLIAMVGNQSGDSISMFYNQDGTISKAEIRGMDDDNYTMMYAWSGNKLTLTETDYPDGKAVIDLNSNGQIVRMESWDFYEQQWILGFYIVYTWAENNLISEETWYPADISSYFRYQSKGTPPAGASIKYSPRSVLRNNHLYGKTRNLKQDFVREVVVTYTYDNKINPLKDFQIYKFSEIAFYSSVNNMISDEIVVYNSSGGIEETYEDSYTFTYNTENYPLSKLEDYITWSFSETYQYE